MILSSKRKTCDGLDAAGLEKSPDTDSLRLVAAYSKPTSLP